MVGLRFTMSPSPLEATRLSVSSCERRSPQLSCPRRSASEASTVSRWRRVGKAEPGSMAGASRVSASQKRRTVLALTPPPSSGQSRRSRSLETLTREAAKMRSLRMAPRTRSAMTSSSTSQELSAMTLPSKDKSSS